MFRQTNERMFIKPHPIAISMPYIPQEQTVPPNPLEKAKRYEKPNVNNITRINKK
jgi:hypothetical protein